MFTLGFLDNISIPPVLSRKDDGIRKEWNTSAGPQITLIAEHPAGRALLRHILNYSPFLSRLIVQYTDFFTEICAQGPDTVFIDLLSSLQESRPAVTLQEQMRILRIIKSKASLVIAVADIAGVWDLEKVTQRMSEIADNCVQQALRFLLLEAASKNEIRVKNIANPEEGSGLFVLAMGKLGACELNYSSDIDLIVFFDSEHADYAEVHELQQQFSKLTQKMTRLLQRAHSRRVCVPG